MGIGQYNGLGAYCGPHTASEVFLILRRPAQLTQFVRELLTDDGQGEADPGKQV